MKNTIFLSILIGLLFLAVPSCKDCNHKCEPCECGCHKEGDIIPQCPDNSAGTKWVMHPDSEWSFQNTKGLVKQLSFGTNIYGINRIQTNDTNDTRNWDEIVNIKYNDCNISFHCLGNLWYSYAGYILADTMFLEQTPKNPDGSDNEYEIFNGRKVWVVRVRE